MQLYDVGELQRLNNLSEHNSSEWHLMITNQTEFLRSADADYEISDIIPFTPLKDVIGGNFVDRDTLSKCFAFLV